MSYAKNHHYVPACYLKQFAVPQSRQGRLFVYDRITGQTSPGSPHASARRRHFYTVEVDGQSPALAEDAYAKIEDLFAPILSGVVQRGTLPTDATEMRKLLAFVATQAARTPRVRELQEGFYSDVHMLLLRTLAADKGAFMASLRGTDNPEFRDMSDDEADELFADLGERVEAAGARVDIPQTRLVGDVLEVSSVLEDVLARRRWVLGVAPSDAQFITSDDPVQLVWAMRTAREPPPMWSPGFEDPNTNVMVPLSPALLLIGLSHEIDRARIRLQRNDVAGFNTDLALASTRYVFSVAPTFAQMTSERAVVEGPTDLLRKANESPPATVE